MSYNLYLMLRERDFEFFTTIVTVRLAENIELEFSFDTDTRERGVTRDEFLRAGGKNIMIPDAEIEFNFAAIVCDLTLSKGGVDGGAAEARSSCIGSRRMDGGSRPAPLRRDPD